MSGPRLIEVIESKVVRGCGATWCHKPHEHEILREVVQYHTPDGELLAERDPVPPERRVVAAGPIPDPL